jgi:beta-lactamase regulating signal transducer with metallopeptidase domain
MLEFLRQSTCVERIGWVLVHSLWQFAVVALLAIVLRRALQRFSATIRYGALLAAMSAMVIVPVATWFSSWSADAPEVGTKLGLAQTPENVSPSHDGNDPMARERLYASSSVERATQPHASPLRSGHATGALISWWSTVKTRVHPWLAQIVLVWLAGVMVVAVRPMLSWHTVRRLKRAGVSPVAGVVQSVLQRTAARLRLTRAVQVLESTLVHTPVVLGYFRPVILLPMCLLTDLPGAQLESILAHELAHIRRHDYLVNLLQAVVETLFFYHPAVWWLSRQIRNERENCCDDVAMATVGNRADYGRALLAIEELRARSTALSVAARGGSLLARIRRIAGHESAPSFAASGSILGLVLASIVIFGAATWGAAPAAEKTAANAGTDPKTSAPDRMALLHAYEKTLVPYQRVKAKWVERFAKLNSANEPEWLDREADEWTVIRDGDRAKSTLTITWKRTSEKSQSPQSQECVWEKGKALVSVHTPGHGPPLPGLGDPNASIVTSYLQASAEDFMRHTGFGLCASRGKISDIKWIPAFLRGATLSAERDTLDGHAVDVLRGISDEDEIKLWLDPALGHIPRKVSYDKRSSALNSPPGVHVYEVKRFEERNGVWVPIEAIETTQTSAHPAVVVDTKLVNGKEVLDFTPKKDKHGEIVMEPAITGLCEAKLVDIQFNPKFIDEDFKISTPIPDGTKISVPLGPRIPHVTYEWRQGKVVTVVEPAGAANQDPFAPNPVAAAGGTRGPNAAARTVRIRVVGPDGEPVARTQVSGLATVKGTRRSANIDLHRCDADGKAVIELPQGVTALHLSFFGLGYLILDTEWEEDRPAGGRPLPRDVTINLIKPNPQALAEMRNLGYGNRIWVEENDKGRRVIVKLAGDLVTDAALELLRRLPDPDELHVVASNVTDAGLAHLERLRGLKALLLVSDEITDAGLAHLEGLRGLKELQLMSPKITDAGLVHLQPLHALEGLTLACSVTDAGMNHLAPLKELRTLIGRRVEADPATHKVFHALGQLTDMEFTDAPLHEVCKYVGDLHGITVQFDELALKRGKISREIPVTINVKNVPLAETLHLLQSLGLDWAVGKGVVLITTKDIVARGTPGTAALQQALPSLKHAYVEW